MIYNILIGGKAGQGPNFLAELISQGLINQGYYVFNSREYESLIRGGHNYNIITFSDSIINSNSTKIDLLICLDDKTAEIHKNELNQKAIILKQGSSNVFYAGNVYKILDLDFKFLDNLLKKLKNYKENIEQAKQGYNQATNSIKLKKQKTKNTRYLDGSEAVAHGALLSGLNIYYAYPMTPSTGVMTHLAQETKNKNNKHLVIELENEISVINAGVGSAITGSKSMVGTSGGGFDLMTETLSMIGEAEVPLPIYLASRVGPGTGAATYQEQSDLNTALYSGHGEFPRLVIAPGDITEAIELTSQAFYFSHKYRIPSIILSDKHLAESKYTTNNKPIITSSQKTIKGTEKFHSYTHTVEGLSTESKQGIVNDHLKKIKKQEAILKEAKKFRQYKLHGKKNSKNLIIGWGSTKGAIFDAIKNIDLGFLQILYLDPLPNIQSIVKNKNIILIENNSTGQLGNLLKKQGINIEEKNKILKADGHAFYYNELKEAILRRLK